jgi:hypothetical protein
MKAVVRDLSMTFLKVVYGTSQKWLFLRQQGNLF